MLYEYEQACSKDNLDKETVKEIRKVFDEPRKIIKKQNDYLDEQGITIFSIDADPETRKEAYSVSDCNCDVEGQAIKNYYLSLLEQAKEKLDPEEREVLDAYFSSEISFSEYSKQVELDRSYLRRQLKSIIKKLRIIMGINVQDGCEELSMF